MDITWPTGTAETIENIIETIGRDVEFFYEASVSGCADCGLNPLTLEPLDPFCTTCSGLYWIPTYESTVVSCHITWKDADNMQWVTGGYYFEGDCKVKLVYSASNYEMINNTSYLVVDGKEMTINKFTLLGVPSVNRIILHTEEKERDSG